jgi:hypothetical protein
VLSVSQSNHLLLLIVGEVFENMVVLLSLLTVHANVLHVPQSPRKRMFLLRDAELLCGHASGFDM